MALYPLLASAILVYNERKMLGVKELLYQAFDCQKIKYKIWYIPIILLMPITAILSFWYLKINEVAMLEPAISVMSVVIFFFVFFIGAIGEELGWSGYIIDPMQNRYGALKAGVILGIIWAVWHIIPYSQAH